MPLEPMKEEFVSEPIRPVLGSSDVQGMARGEPGFPRRFLWRDKEYALDELLETWKESGPCKSHSGEMYLRKHWFRIRTTDGLQMKIYFERQPRSKGQAKNRWWLFTICQSE